MHFGFQDPNSRREDLRSDIEIQSVFVSLARSALQHYVRTHCRTWLGIDTRLEETADKDLDELRKASEDRSAPVLATPRDGLTQSRRSCKRRSSVKPRSRAIWMSKRIKPARPARQSQKTLGRSRTSNCTHRLGAQGKR